MRYDILRRTSPEELTEAVNAYINAGWEVLGGPLAYVAVRQYEHRDGYLANDAEYLWAQAVIKRHPAEQL